MIDERNDIELCKVQMIFTSFAKRELVLFT